MHLAFGYKIIISGNSVMPGITYTSLLCWDWTCTHGSLLWGGEIEPVHMAVCCWIVCVFSCFSIASSDKE